MTKNEMYKYLLNIYMYMNKILIISLLLIPTLFLGSAIGQTEDTTEIEEIEIIENNETTVILGNLKYTFLKMDFIPLTNLVVTNAASLNFAVEKEGSISLAGFVNTINGILITPDNKTYEIESLQSFSIDFSLEGNYSIVIQWGSWIPVFGGLVEKITGSGEQEIIIVYILPEEPSKVIDYSFYFIIAILGAILVTLFLGRKQIRVWLK